MTLIISDRWWQREIECGKRRFYSGQFEQAVINFYRAAQHAESALYLRTQIDNNTSNMQLLRCAYLWLSDSFAALDDAELQAYYSDLATLSLRR